jgi:Fe2+ or Zn2+ uptake regulation protein
LSSVAIIGRPKPTKIAVMASSSAEPLPQVHPPTRCEKRLIPDLELLQIYRYGRAMTSTNTPDPAQILRQHGLSVTAQRLAVMAAVGRHPHATADVVFEVVSTDIGSVSRQAVYDALGVLAENGIIRRIQPAGSAARYEDRVGDNHHHLICRQCNRLVDIDCALGARPCLTASDDHGFEIDEAEVIYWGRCPDCRSEADTPLLTPQPAKKGVLR